MPQFDGLDLGYKIALALGVATTLVLLFGALYIIWSKDRSNFAQPSQVKGKAITIIKDDEESLKSIDKADQDNDPFGLASTNSHRPSSSRPSSPLRELAHSPPNSRPSSPLAGSSKSSRPSSPLATTRSSRPSSPLAGPTRPARAASPLATPRIPLSAYTRPSANPAMLQLIPRPSSVEPGVSRTSQDPIQRPSSTELAMPRPNPTHRSPIMSASSSILNLTPRASLAPRESNIPPPRQASATLEQSVHSVFFPDSSAPPHIREPPASDRPSPRLRPSEAELTGRRCHTPTEDPSRSSYVDSSAQLAPNHSSTRLSPAPSPSRLSPNPSPLRLSNIEQSSNQSTLDSPVSQQDVHRTSALTVPNGPPSPLSIDVPTRASSTEDAPRFSGESSAAPSTSRMSNETRKSNRTTQVISGRTSPHSNYLAEPSPSLIPSSPPHLSLRFSGNSSILDLAGTTDFAKPMFRQSSTQTPRLSSSPARASPVQVTDDPNSAAKSQRASLVSRGSSLNSAKSKSAGREPPPPVPPIRLPAFQKSSVLPSSSAAYQQFRAQRARAEGPPRGQYPPSVFDEDSDSEDEEGHVKTTHLSVATRKTDFSFDCGNTDYDPEGEAFSVQALKKSWYGPGGLGPGSSPLR